MWYNIIAKTSTNQVKIINKNLFFTIFFYFNLSDLLNILINMTEHSEFSKLSEFFQLLSEIFKFNDYNFNKNQAFSVKYSARFSVRY